MSLFKTCCTLKCHSLLNHRQKPQNEVSNMLYQYPSLIHMQVNVTRLSFQNNLKFPSCTSQHNVTIPRYVNADDRFHTHDTILHQSIKLSYANKPCISMACGGFHWINVWWGRWETCHFLACNMWKLMLPSTGSIRQERQNTIFLLQLLWMYAFTKDN